MRVQRRNGALIGGGVDRCKALKRWGMGMFRFVFPGREVQPLADTKEDCETGTRECGNHRSTMMRVFRNANRVGKVQREM